MIIPEYLKKGDTIAIAAPARKISPEEMEPALQFLQESGYQVYYDERLWAAEHQFAGSDEVRSQYIQDLLDRPDIQAIWCARGGYGSVRIIDRLDFTTFRAHPKWIIGYSDVTVFHTHINQNLGIATLHATMPVNVKGRPFDQPHLQTMIHALSGNALRYEIPTHPLTHRGNFDAPVIGGNLSILYSLLGSPSDIDTAGKVLFIEDLDEYLYHIDRMMENLDRNGKLSKLAGLVVGHLSDMHDNTIPFGKSADEIVAEHCRKYDFPVIFNFPAGHLTDNRAIRMGCNMRCSIQNDSIIIEN